MDMNDKTNKITIDERDLGILLENDADTLNSRMDDVKESIKSNFVITNDTTRLEIIENLEATKRQCDKIINRVKSFDA